MPPTKPINRARSPLEDTLLCWAADHWIDPVNGILDRWGDWEYERKCLGAIVRRIVNGSPPAADGARTWPPCPHWIIEVAESAPDQLLALAPYIGTVQMPWGPMPAKLGWPGWIKALNDVAQFDDRHPFDTDKYRDLLPSVAVTPHDKVSLTAQKPTKVKSRPESLFVQA